MKRQLIKTMTVAMVATMMLASCKKDNNSTAEANIPEDGFRAVTEQSGGESRTHGVPNGSDNITVQWTVGDQIKVANSTGATLTFGLIEGENTTEGTFKTGEPHNDFFMPNYVAIYPAANAAGTANTLSATMVTFNIPQTQIYLANSFAEKAMPMVAYSTDQILAFKNVFGGLCFPIRVSSGTVTVTSLELETKGNEALWGTCTTTIGNDGIPNNTATTNTDATPKKTVILDCGSGVTLSTTATDFYIMVPPGTLQSGFTVRAKNGTTTIYERTTIGTPPANFIPRSVVRKLNEDLTVEMTQLTVTTIAPTFITKNSALGLGMADNTPIQCGFLYAKGSDLTNPANELLVENANNTTIFNLAATAGIRFDANLTNLIEDEVYYVRAWAEGTDGIVYGDPIPFATRFDYYGQNDGKSRSTFTVRANGTSVHFSMGNLQYCATGSTPTAVAGASVGGTWRFAENQFDYVGDATYGNVYEGGVKCNNASIAQDYSGWIDLFGWGTSGYNHGANCYQPWSIIETNSEYYPYGSNANLNSNSGKADWGYNAISNGGNTENQWRTLQGHTVYGNSAEWNYLFNTRSVNYHRYAVVQLTVQGTSSYTNVGTVNGVSACGTTVNGIVLFPDTFSWPSGVGELTRYDASATFPTNKLTESQWSLLEQAGAVFLPGAGFRYGTTASAGNAGFYWSTTYQNDNDARCLTFFSAPSDGVNPRSSAWRYQGLSVRLVCGVE